MEVFNIIFAVLLRSLLRDALHSADCAVARRPSVRPSVCLFVCLSHVVVLSKRLNIIFKLFSLSGSHTILVFFLTCRFLLTVTRGNATVTVWQYSGTTLTGASNAESEKNHDFRPISHCISEMIQDRARVTMEGEKETVHKLSNGTMNLTRFEGHDRTVTRDQCCKGDTSSQWEKANVPLSPHPHPLTDSHEILHT